jgi:manganese transport protein
VYKKILVTLENGRADATLLPHVADFARNIGAGLLLLHVADGWAARNFEQLQLAESDEMRADRAYLETSAQTFRNQGLQVDIRLALGNPPSEIVKMAAAEHCDLIAMASHGHKLLGDIIHGSTIDKVRHETSIPLLVVRAVMDGP